LEAILEISSSMKQDNYMGLSFKIKRRRFPIADNKSENGRRANRRVVLIRVEQ